MNKECSFFLQTTPAGQKFFHLPRLSWFIDTFHTSSSWYSTERKQIIKMYLGDLPH